MGFEGDPPAVSVTFERGELSREVERTFTEFNTSLSGTTAIATRVLDVDMVDTVLDERIVIVHRVIGSIHVEDVARVPHDDELRIAGEMAEELASLCARGNEATRLILDANPNSAAFCSLDQGEKLSRRTSDIVRSRRISTTEESKDANDIGVTRGCGFQASLKQIDVIVNVARLVHGTLENRSCAAADRQSSIAATSSDVADFVD